MRQIIFVTFFLFITVAAFAQEARRKAIMGLRFQKDTSLLIIDSVFANSTAAALNLKKGDILTVINDKPVNTVDIYNQIAGPIRTGDKITIQFTRGGKQKQAAATAVEKPFATAENADLLYGWVPFKEGMLRTITYKPKDKEKCPAILLVPGYGCGSIENYPSAYNGRLINEWVKNGYAVVTIEKSGVGDSYNCAPCTEVDLATEIESFDSGYSYMQRLPFADTSNLFIWGHSMGGTIAPEIARLHKPKGVMVFACVYRPWSEFLLEMHRVQKPLLEGFNYTQTEDFLRQIQSIYFEFFRLKKSPAELYENLSYRNFVVSELNYKAGSNNMWGRHWRFWQQLDSVNLAVSWQQVNCPVLILHGGADYEQCSMVEPLMIKETVNSAHPGFATQVTIADLDHFMMKSKDWKEAAYNFKNQQYLKGNFNYSIAQETVKWLQGVATN